MREGTNEKIENPIANSNTKKKNSSKEEQYFSLDEYNIYL